MRNSYGTRDTSSRLHGDNPSPGMPTAGTDDKNRGNYHIAQGGVIKTGNFITWQLPWNPRQLKRMERCRSVVQ